MGHKFADIAFTDSVKAIQTELGSRASYDSMEGGEDYNHRLGSAESSFIAQRDSLYMASVSTTGWPYVQHRGGPQGFVKILDDRTIGFADYSGNRQYVSVGNFETDNRVALFFMDYPNRRRLKVLGKVRIAPLDDHRALDKLEDGHYRAQIERGIVITIEAFDWNCPQFITPRYSESEVSSAMQSLREENARLRETSVDTVTAPANSVLAPEVLGEGPLHLRISALKQLAPNVRAYELRSTTGEKLPAFDPGAHLRIPVRLEDETLTNREYSIASDSEQLDHYEIAVNYEPDGRGGSRAVHANFQLGTELQLEAPRNQFPLHTGTQETILVAGGIGITPIKSMAHELDRRGVKFRLLYAGKSRSDAAYLEELLYMFPDRVQFFSSSEKNRLVVTDVLSEVTTTTAVYICGPKSLTEEFLLRAKEKGIPGEQINIEMFS